MNDDANILACARTLERLKVLVYDCESEAVIESINLRVSKVLSDLRGMAAEVYKESYGVEVNESFLDSHWSFCSQRSWEDSYE